MAPTSTRQALDAVRTLATGLRTSGSNKSAAFTNECLEAAEALIQVTSPQGDEHAARLVLQWAVAVLKGRGGQQQQQQQQQQTPTQREQAPVLPEAAKEERVWQVCRLAVLVSSSSSLVATLPLASALGLLNAVAATVFYPSTSTSTATAAVSAFTALTSRGLPQLPADKVLDLVADVVEQLYRHHHNQHHNQHHHHHQQQQQQQQLQQQKLTSCNELGAAALQFLVNVQSQQGNQRKAFSVLTSRIVQPLLALHQQLQTQPKTLGGGGGVMTLRRAIDAVLGELLFHREHVEGLRALLAPGGKASGSSSSSSRGGGSGSKKRHRAVAAATAAAAATNHTPVAEKVQGGEEETAPASPPPPSFTGQQANKWASYQGQFFLSLDSWLNNEKDKRTKKDVALSLGHLYRLFVRRLAAVAVMSMKDDLRVTKQGVQQQSQLLQPQQQQQGSDGQDDRGATAVAAAVGQKRRDVEMAAAAASSSSLVSRPAFVLGVKLWSLLWTGAGKEEEQQEAQQEQQQQTSPAAARTQRLVAARGVLEAMVQLNVYHYDSDQSPAGQYRAIETMFLELLKRGGTREGRKEGERDTEVTGMEGEEVRCLATLLRIDHRVAETCLSQLLALLTQRFAVVGKLSSFKEEGREGEGREQQQQQVVASANNALRQACARTVAELAETYSRLRQNDVLFQAFLSLELEGDATATALVGHPEVTAAVGRAVRECPPPQLVPLWDLLAPTSVFSNSRTEEGEMEVEENESGFVTYPTLGHLGIRSKLFGLFVDNVRVSPLNALELGIRTGATMTQMTKVVLEQLQEGLAATSGKGENKRKKDKKGKQEKHTAGTDGETVAAAGASAGAAVVGVALDLYARLLEVQVMCSFWLDNSNSSSSSSSSSVSTLDFPSGALFLQTIIPHSPRLSSCKGAVDRIVVGRLRQLLLERGVHGVGATSEGMADPEVEQRGLVAFLFQGHARDDDTTNDGHDADGGAGEQYHHRLNLSLLGASLPLWASHCKTEHLDLLWSAVFSDSLTVVRSQKPNINRPSIRLLTDAAFYEITPLAYRCVPSWARLVLDCLINRSGGALEEVEGWAERGDVKALLCATEQVLSPPTRAVRTQGKIKRGQAAATAAAEGPSSSPVFQLTAKTVGKADESGEDAMARAKHYCRLLNSMPPGYLPTEHEPLRFLLSILLSRVVTRNRAQASAQTMHLTLSASTLLALQRAPEAIVPLLATSKSLIDEWLIKLVLPASVDSTYSSSSSSAASKHMGLQLLGCYLEHVVKQRGTEGGMKEEQRQHCVAQLLQALVKQGLLVTLEGDIATKGEDDEEDMRHALRAVRVLVAPYLGSDGLWAGGRETVVDLVAKQIGPAVTRRLSSSLSSEALRASAALLELIGRTRYESEVEEGRSRKRMPSFSLPYDVVLRVLTKATTSARGQEKRNTDGVIEFLAAYLRWAERKEEAQEEGIILEEMVRLAVLPSSSVSSMSSADEEDQHAACVAAAIGNARGGNNVQLLALHRLTHLLDAVKVPLPSSHSKNKEAETRRAAETLARACRLFEKLVEQGGMGEGPGAQAVRQVAQPFLGPMTQILSALFARVLSSRTIDSSNDVRADMLAGMLRGLNVLRLYARKRWLFPSGGGMRVKDLGRLLAAIASLPQALQGMEGEELEDGEQVSQREEVFGAACGLLSALLKHHPRLVYQCAPPFFFLTRALLRVLLAENSNCLSVGWGPTAAKAWTRLAEHLAGHATPLRRHLMLLVVDYLHVCPHLRQEFKGALQPAAFALMDTLTSFEVQHMHAALLDAAGQALLKKLHSDYQQRHKYRGKV